MFDLVIRHGLVVDGTGSSARVADVAVADGRVVDVGPSVAGRGRREIEAEGLLVTPGFVDIHTHYDAQATWDPWLTPSSWHGCTTVVSGNCGVGFAPAAPDRHDWLIGLMEGVEDIPGAAMAEGITWGWESFPEFLDVLDAAPRAIDLGVYIGHAPLRAYVMGERGALNEVATEEDLFRMRACVTEALRAGALGVSTSQTTLHKAKTGEYVPGTFVDSSELFALADAVGDAGHGIIQLAMEHADVPAGFPTLREMARRSRSTVSFNLNQPEHAPDVWKEDLRLLEQAQLDGLSIVAQAAGRSIGVLECLEGTLHPFVLHDTWRREVASLPLAEKVRVLRDGPVRERLLDESLRPANSPIVGLLTGAWDRMYAVGVGDIDYEPNPSTDSLAARAASEGRRAIELALDVLCAYEGRGMLYVPLFNYSSGDLSMIEALHRHPLTRMGLSDAGAHCGSICDGGVPTFMLTHWVRDRVRGDRLPLELVVHRQTQQTAALVGLGDRGVLAPGYRADINVIDFDRLGFDNAQMAYDFPGGARRLVQRGRGYVHTFVHGQSVVENDAFTGALPGRLVRGPASSFPAPSSSPARSTPAR